MTLSELAAAGRPALLVPYPHAAEDHQTVNARRFAAEGAARVLAQSELTPERLARELTSLVADDAGLERMGTAARRASGARARETIAEACSAWLG